MSNYEPDLNDVLAMADGPTDLLDNTEGVEVDMVDSEFLEEEPTRRSTDLVRLYLQEIGRVPLLGRDEEVSLAQKVQDYMKLLDLRFRLQKD
ncbi:MAG: sigma-70 factor domain-containing protein, partial [Cyanobacteriota bacterium]